MKRDSIVAQQVKTPPLTAASHMNTVLPYQLLHLPSTC